MSPFFLTSDPFVAERLLDAIRRDAKVQTLARLLADLYLQPGDPFENLAFLPAYEEAIVSVGNGTTVQALNQEYEAALHRSRLTRQAANAVFYPLEWLNTRFLEVEGSGNKYKAKGFPFNPLDWIVLFHEIDVDRAFPNGRPDFDRVHHQNFPAPELYPLRAGFAEERSVSADLFFSRFNLVSFLIKELTKYLTSAVVNDRVTFPKSDTIYVMRGIGPAFVPAEDFAFVNQNFQAEYLQAVAINLVSAIVDLSNVLIDQGALDGDAAALSKFIAKIANEILKIAPTIKSADDFVKGASKLGAFFLKEFVNDVLKNRANNALKKGSEKLADKASAGAVGPLKVLKIIGGIGQVVERASGLARATTLETTFIVVGDPFQLEILEVNPPGASLGDDVEIVIRGARFDQNNPRDSVFFDRDSGFDQHADSAAGGSDEQIGFDRKCQRARAVGRGDRFYRP